MARNLRGSRYRDGATIGEDVNPSAYIVNLADCMLVLALGCLVALVGAFNIDLNMTEIDSESLEQVDPTEIENDLAEQGSYYVEAGTVYMDPRTGELFMVQDSTNSSLTGDLADVQGASPDAAPSGASASPGASADNASNGSAAPGAGSSTTSDDDVRAARANGAD